MTELLVGTKKGLFVLEGEPGAAFEVTARAFAGEPVEYAMRDPRSGRMLASVTSPFYGPKIWYTDDPRGRVGAGGGRRAAGGRRRRAGADLGDRDRRGATGSLYAGGDPGVLFESHDGGASLELNRGALGAPDARRLAARRRRALPALDRDRGPATRPARGRGSRPPGVWLTDDGGATWRRGNDGLVARYLPEDAPADESRALRAPPPARAEAARAAVHAVPRRRVPLRRRRRVVDRHRPGPARRTSASRSRSTPPTPTAPT